ncbi:MAG: hypothetical protein AB8F74_10285 [Saprospiraceae bacterium]
MSSCFACQREPIVSEVPKERNTTVVVLLYKKEKRLETWDIDTLGNTKRHTSQILEMEDLPLGLFPISSKDDLLYANFKTNKLLRKTIENETGTDATFQNDLLSLLSLEKTEDLNQLLQNSKVKEIAILPNDIYVDGSFQPSMNGPVWMPELYASLEIWMKDFTAK